VRQQQRNSRRNDRGDERKAENKPLVLRENDQQVEEIDFIVLDVRCLPRPLAYRLISHAQTSVFAGASDSSYKLWCSTAIAAAPRPKLAKICEMSLSARVTVVRSSSSGTTMLSPGIRRLPSSDAVKKPSCRLLFTEPSARST